MKQNWRFSVLMGILIAMFAFQVYYLSKWEKSFSEGMERSSERVQRDAVAAGVPLQQAQAISSVMSETSYEVVSHVRNVSSMLVMFNFTMVMAALMAKQKTAL